MKKMLAIVLTLVMMLSCLSIATAETNVWDPATAKIDWKQFAGTELRLYMLQHMVTQAIEPYLGEFEELTGMKVNLETLPESDYNSKMLIELNSGSDNPFDICMVSSGSNFASGNWLVDLTQFIENPALTDKEWYNMDDIFPSAINYGTWNGVFHAIPFSAEYQIMYYRKDILDKYGIEVPTTLEELAAACEKVYDPANNQYAIVARLKKGVGTDVIYNNFLSAYGGEFIKRNEDGELICQLGSQAAIDAADYYMGLLSKYGAPGQVNYGYSEAITEFMQGNAVFFIDSTSFIGQILNPEESKVIGKVGYAPVPAGPAGPDSPLHFSHWQLTLGPKSNNKEAAWLFLQRVTSSDLIKRCGLAMGTSTRQSLYDSEEYKAQYDQAFIDALLNGAGRGLRIEGWNYPCWSGGRDFEVQGLQEIYEGASAAEVMPRVADQITDIFYGY